MKNGYAAMILATVMSMQEMFAGGGKVAVELSASKTVNQAIPRLRPVAQDLDEVPPFMLDDLPVPEDLESILMGNGVAEEAVSGFGDYILRLTAACCLIEKLKETDLEGQYIDLFKHPRVAYALVKRMKSLHHSRLLLDMLAAKITYAPGEWSRWWLTEDADAALKEIARYCDDNIHFFTKS
jgi:hypothetical protein